jgi:hypothetical protein
MAFNAVQEASRVIIFGLYSSAFTNNNKYLQEIETEELANLLADYNAKIADLTNQEAIVVADIISRRYVETIEKIIHDGKMETKRLGIEADDDVWDAKIAALSSDTAALTTMAEKVSAETQKTAAKITELEAYIEIEGIRLSETDIEIAEKEIQSAKIDIQKLNVSNEIIKIQIDTVKTAQELIDIDLRIARAKVDSAQTDHSINKIDLLDSELTIEKGRTQIAEAERDVAEARVELAQSRLEEVQDEVDYYNNILPAQSDSRTDKKIEVMELKSAGLSNNLTDRRAEKDLMDDIRENEVNAEETMVGRNAAAQVTIDGFDTTVHHARASDILVKENAKEEAARIMATASIGTTLTHTIKKATE